MKSVAEGMRVWGAFGLVSLIWGSSFLFIKIALNDVQPFTLVGARLLLGAMALFPFVVGRRSKVPRDVRTWMDLLFIGVFGTALPFTLISWGEERITSGLASILIGTVPLFSILIADSWLGDKPVTLGKFAGIFSGFLGVVILLGESLNKTGNWTGATRHLALILAALCYAINNIYTRRRLSHLSPLILAFFQVLLGSIIVWIPAVTIESPSLFSMIQRRQIASSTLMAILALGFFGSGLAYLFYHFLIKELGATRTSLTTYVMPVTGVVLGVVVLDERFSWRLLVGGLCIVGGIFLASWKGRSESFRR